jgi:hypothetical protein
MSISSVNEYREPAEELRRLAREPYVRNPELQAVGRRIRERRSGREREVLESLLKTNPEIERLLSRDRAGDEELRREAREIFSRLDERALEDARESGRRLHAVRRSFLGTFGAQLAAAEGKSQLKFRNAIFWDSDTQLARCSEMAGHWTEPEIGPDVISEAEIVRSPDGMWLHPFISCDNNNCVSTEAGSTFQHVTYQMTAPAENFAVDRIRVDAIFTGRASIRLGESWGWFPTRVPDPLFEHTTITLDLYITQQTADGWQYWPLVSEKVFQLAGDYAAQVRIALSGNPYPGGIVIRNAASGGGPILCLVQVACSTTSTGEYGHTRLDFRKANGLGVFMGGVALLGQALI